MKQIILIFLCIFCLEVMAATDPFPGQSSVLSSAINGFAITPSDSVDLTIIPKAIVVATDGVLRCTLSQMTDGTFLDLPVLAGYNALRCKRVWSAGTTTTNIFGLY